MSASNEQVALPSPAMLHGSVTTTSAAGAAVGTTVALDTSTSNVKITPSKQRSRGGAGGLRQDFVFPKPSPTPSVESSTVSSSGLETKLDNLSLEGATPNSSTGLTNGDSHNDKSMDHGSLAPPKTQQLLKTHYRTHSRNGSTVTVKDIKQAIATVRTEPSDVTPVVVVSSNQEGSTESTPETPASQTLADPSEVPKGAPLQEAMSQSGKSPRQGLAIQVNPAKLSLTVDTASAPTTPLLSPVSSRPVPPLFACSILHEFPYYHAPRLFLPGSAGPTSLPSSPFARKRKHTYHHTPVTFPSTTITVKLPGQDKSVTCHHHQTVGSVPDIELADYDLEEEYRAEAAEHSDIRTQDEGESRSTSPLPPTSEEVSQIPTNTTTSRTKGLLPPSLNIIVSSSSENSSNSAPGSPSTPSTPSRRRRSQSAHGRKNRNSDSVQDSGKEVTAGGAAQANKKGSRSLSRSRSTADGGSTRNSSCEPVPPIPQTPTRAPTHNTLASAGPPSATGTGSSSLLAPASATEPSSPSTLAPPNLMDTPTSPTLAPRTPIAINTSESDLKRRGPRPARLLNTRPAGSLHTLNEGNQALFTPRSARDGSSDYFSMRPQHPPRTPMTPSEDEDNYSGRLQMVTTPMIQNGFFPAWAKGDAQLEEIEGIRQFLSVKQYPDEMPLSDEW